MDQDEVEANGIRISYRAAGQGAPLVHLHGTGRPEPAPAHDLLARERRVIAFEMPANTLHQGTPDLARTMLEATAALGIDTFDLLGTSFGAATALWAAILAPARVSALVLESPAAIRPGGQPPPPDRDAKLEDAMRGLQVPVLVVFGTGDRVIPPEMGRVYRRLLPRCQLLFVYDAGHAVSGDRPEAFTEAVADFLARHEQYVVSDRSTVLFP
jgi:pimeloyl-ACP methyl ester carboxylesterase